MDSQGYESDSTVVVDAEVGGDSSKKRPFPIVQLCLIYLTIFAEPLTTSVIYPFMSALVWHTGIACDDETKIGYFAGAIESAFFFAECLSVVHWSRLANRIGRRPVVLLGTFGISISIFVLGTSGNYWIIIVARCVQGVFNGAIGGVGKSMVIEITDPSDVPKAFGWVPAAYCVGITLGPVLGGALSDAANKWPDSLGKSSYLTTHPYFLPCGVVGGVSFASFLFAWCFLKESLILTPQPETRVNGKRSLSSCHQLDSAPLLKNGEANLRMYGNSSYDTPGNMKRCSEENFWVLLNRPLLVSLINVAFTSLMDQSFLVLIALMFSTSIVQGGLALDPLPIGLLLGGWGAFNSVFQVVAFTRVMQWLGPRRMLISCFSCFLFMFLAFPVMSYLAKVAGTIDWIVVGVLVVQLSCFSVVYMSYGCSQLFLLDVAPSGVSLASLYGWAQTASTLARGIAPIVASSLFSISIQEQLVGGYMVYFVLMGFTLVGIYMMTKSSNQIKIQKC